MFRGINKRLELCPPLGNLVGRTCGFADPAHPAAFHPEESDEPQFALAKNTARASHTGEAFTPFVPRCVPMLFVPPGTNAVRMRSVS